MNNKIKKLEKNISRELVEELYITQNLTKEEVAKKLNITQWSLSNLFKLYKIKKTNDKILEMRKETCLKKYGTEFSSSSDIVKQKAIDTNMKRYGAKTATMTDETKTKIKQTKFERYGNANYNNKEQSNLTKAIKYNNENYNNRDKYRETMSEKYGVDNGFKLESTKKNNLEKIIKDKNYSSIFKEVFNDREKAINLLSKNKYSYFDLSILFNAPYYVIQMWATKLDIKEYIDFSFEGKSHYEDEIVEFLNSLNITNIERNTKQYLDGQEIDIYLPEYHIGIEFNGTYWHSDLYKDKNYHFNKSLIASEKNIRLIHIYQYEWDSKITQEKIKSLLKIALGKAENKIYARDCELRKISDKEASILNNEVHLQNHRKAHLTYGLFYKGQLVQLMSFSKNKKYEWEIIRGCPASNNIVVGGVSKLFKHFIRENNPSQIFSYCDFNKFDGHGYEQLGMKFIGYTGPDMKYIIKGKVFNRQPSKYKELKSKIEARIYGAGSKKYLWEANN